MSEPILADANGRNTAAHPLVAVVGPTASGKSALGLAIAERFGGEIVNFDSVQTYRGLDIGSGKTPLGERRNIPHHLLDIVEPGEPFSAGDFRRQALRVIRSLRARGKLPVLVGGTGLYLRALLDGLFLGPRRSEVVRARLRQIATRRGGAFLHRLLERKDAARARAVHPNDTQKVIRALEVCLMARGTMSGLLKDGREPLLGFGVIKIGLNPPRAELHRRIDERVRQMFARGWLREAERLATEPHAGSTWDALGYREALAVVRGEMAEGAAAAATQAATRRYARRQMTWFRRERGVRWYAGFGDRPEVVQQVLEWLAKELAREPEGTHAPASEIEGNHEHTRL